MKKIILVSIFIFCAFYPELSLSAGAKGTSSKIVDLYASLHGDPAPAMVGLNVGFTVFDTAKIHAGYGYYSDWLGPNLGPALRKEMGPSIFYGFAFPIVYVVTTIFSSNHKGHILSYSKVKGWFGSTERPYTHRRLEAAGSGIQLKYPGLILSPTIGISTSHYQANSEFWGNPKEKTFYYYSVGLNLSYSPKNDMSLGYNKCMRISQKACGLYFNISSFL